MAVEDIKRTQNFYTCLDFKLNGNPTSDLVSFLFGEKEFVIHFFEKERLKESLEGENVDLRLGNEVMFSLAAESKEEYDSWIIEIRKAGGSIIFNSNVDRKKLYDDNGFFVCVFADPDGHKFNLLFNANK